MIIIGDDSEEISQFRKKLFREFEMKDLGERNYFLGIEILCFKKIIFITQRKYALKVHIESSILDC